MVNRYARRLVLVMALFAAYEAVWAENTILGVHKSWVAQQYSESGSRVCMMWSQPEKSEGNYSQRGDIYLFVSRRPENGSRGKVRFDSGYEFKPNSTVEVAIDDQSFELVTDGSTAWFIDSTRDEAMIKAMRAGRSMIVTGTSSRGNETRDTYSLYGFTAAYKAISGACR